MRRNLNNPAKAFLALVLALSGASAARAVSAVDVAKATPKLLRELDRGADEVKVIVGIKDGTPSPRTLMVNPDPEGEPDRRVRRIAAQKRLVQETPDEQFQARHYYESFSMLAGTASRAGALALSARSDVAWIALDGVKRPVQATPQNAQLLINSDQANNRGFTGKGQAVAVIDTGVDYTIATMGGGQFPNSKVIGGTDTADRDSDPMDCEGHGTEVSGIVAGPTGVAPDAKIVAIKVFSSTSPDNASCTNEANDSDILQGINYAITNRATFGIGTINISLGGSFDDGADHGYCDADEPSYESAFESAMAAGMVVAVSAGNDGTTSALSAPACVSAAVSVGAVYSDTFRRVTWADPGGCTDSPAAPDQIVCFSNSATNLSLLAPGAFWAVAKKGGAIDDRFAGTSPSAGAVSGAVAVLRQARPDLSPAGIVGVLRSSGKTITDSRNSVSTPRVDVLAAVQYPAERFAAYSGPAIGVPDGSGASTATVTTSGFTQPLATVQVWVEIDHPDPSQLRVTLIGPDGTTVVLQDQFGRPQHPINAIYGKSDSTAQSLGAFQGKQANGVWTLRVEDKVAGVTGKIRNFTITLVPGQPIEPIPASASGSVLPVVAHIQGTKFFKSDLRLYNPTPSPRSFSLYYVAAGQTGATAAKTTRTVGPGQVLALNDVILSEYNLPDSIGQMTVLGPDTNFIVTSRAYTQGDNGTFGLFVPGLKSSGGLSFGSGRATANGLLKNSQFHTNVGFTEVSGTPVTIRIDLFDANGAPLASTTRSTDPYTTLLVTDIIADRGLPATANFRVDFTVTSGSGRIVPFATYVDDATGDGSFQGAANPAASAEDIIVPQTSHVTGANSDFFRTNFNVTNLDSQPVSVTVSLLPLLISGTPNPPRVYTLQPGQTLEKLDILQTEFNLNDPSAAGLRIRPSAPARLAVSTRTYVQKFGGTFGFSVAGFPASSAIGAGATATAIQLDQTSDPVGYRSNFGFTEVAGAPVNVRVTIKSGDTGATLGSKLYALDANSSFQANVTDVIGAGANATNVYAQFTVESGAGRILPYGASVDNKSGDAIYIPAE